MQYLQKNACTSKIIRESHIEGQSINPVCVEMWCLVEVLHERK